MKNDLTYSDKGLSMTKFFEGLRLKAYVDPGGGEYTIGYGHTGDVSEGQVVTEGEAESLLAVDLGRPIAFLNDNVTVKLTQGQFDALVDFGFNVGLGALDQSTLLSLVNEGDFAKAAGEFSKWIYSGGQVLPGLVTRRSAETQMFNTGEWQSPTPAKAPATVAKAKPKSS